MYFRRRWKLLYKKLLKVDLVSSSCCLIYKISIMIHTKHLLLIGVYHFVMPFDKRLCGPTGKGLECLGEVPLGLSL